MIILEKRHWHYRPQLKRPCSQYARHTLNLTTPHDKALEISQLFFEIK